MKGQAVPLPADAPEIGGKYRHYKGDCYRVKLLALHSNDGEWMVVYEPLYENPAVALFTRPLREWYESVVWEGRSALRFTRVS